MEEIPGSAVKPGETSSDVGKLFLTTLGESIIILMGWLNKQQSKRFWVTENEDISPLILLQLMCSGRKEIIGKSHLPTNLTILIG